MRGNNLDCAVLFVSLEEIKLCIVRIELAVVDCQANTIQDMIAMCFNNDLDTGGSGTIALSL